MMDNVIFLNKDFIIDKTDDTFSFINLERNKKLTTQNESVIKFLKELFETLFDEEDPKNVMGLKLKDENLLKLNELIIVKLLNIIENKEENNGTM